MRALHILFVLLCLNATAQNWCVPGATWTNTFSNGWTHDGFARSMYTGDTVVGGVVAQRIDRYAEGSMFNGEPFAYALDPIFTTGTDDLISIWNGQGYDTLFHFGALPGDAWRLAPPFSTDPVEWVEVTDTGSVVIDGIPLRYLVVSELGTTNDTIVQRLGVLQRNMAPWTQFTTDTPDGPLRCYSDQDIDHTASWWNFGCTSITGMADPTSLTMASPYPNPGDEHVSIELPAGTLAVTMYDNTGRRVLNMPAVRGHTTMDTRALASGAYTLHVTRRGAGAKQFRWVKK